MYEQIIKYIKSNIDQCIYIGHDSWDLIYKFLNPIHPLAIMIKNIDIENEKKKLKKLKSIEICVIKYMPYKRNIYINFLD